MYSFIAWLLTLIQVGTALIAYLVQSALVFNAVIVYGSPFYLSMTMLRSDSVLTDNNTMYVWFIVFHIIKYFAIIKAQLSEESNMLRTMAIVFEAAYLATSAYYWL